MAEIVPRGPETVPARVPEKKRKRGKYRHLRRQAKSGGQKNVPDIAEFVPLVSPLITAANLAGRGFSAQEIAEEIGGGDQATIVAVLRLFGIELMKKPWGMRPVPLRMQKATLARLERAAKARRCTAMELASRIIATVVTESMIDGVLDDEGEFRGG